MTEEQNSNMELWNEVCETDIKNTKQVNQRGGFTAIQAQSQIMRATEMWGPYGGLWGVKDCVYDYLRDAKGEILEATLEAKFFYPTGSRGPASFEISTDYKYRAGDDCRKKMLTDLTTKALSKLGFNADIFLGLWDDNKYVDGKGGDAKAATPAEAFDL